MKKKDNEIDYGLEPTVKGLTTVYDVQKKPTEPTVNETIKTGVTGVVPSKNYSQGYFGDFENGNFFSGMFNESGHNKKIDLGYDSQYDKTYLFNYNPKYQQQADKFRGQAQEYGDFEYDYRTDPQFLAMANLYGNNAKKAMDQTLASASAANGGRLTSSAIAAASQAYQDKMANVEQEVPQLRQAAYNMYNDDYNRIRTNMLDAENAGINDYNIWSDNYDRMYTNAWDLINHETNSKLVDSQIRSSDAAIATNDKLADEQVRSGEAVRESTAFNDALLASDKIGSVTKELADMIGVPEGTPMQAAKEFVEKYKLEVGNMLGYIPTGNVTDYGFENGGKTVERENVEGNLAIGQQNANTAAANAATAAKQAQNDYQLGRDQLFYNIAESTGVFPGAYTSSFGYGDYGDKYTLDAQKFAGSVYDSIGGYPAPFLNNLPYYGYPWVPNWQAQTYMAKMNGGSGINYGTSGGTSSGGGTGTSGGTSSGGGTGTSGGTMSTQSALDTVNKGGTYVDKINTAYALAGSGQITESQFNDILKNLGAK